MTAARHVVIGVGNELRGDDAVGLEVLRLLRGRVAPGVTLLECEQEPSRLIDAWRDAQSAIVVDAVASGAEPGSVHRFDSSTAPIPARVFRSSTHAFGVRDAIEISRALGTLPPHVVVIGIEGEDFSAGVGLSRAAAAAVERAAAAVETDLARLTGEEATCTSER